MRRTSDVADADPTGCVDGIGEGFVVAIALIIALLLLLFVAIPLLVAIVDLLIVLLIFLLSLAARVVFRRPWLVEARADNGLTWRWRVVGWRASGEKVTEIAQLLSTGAALPVGAVPG